MMDEAPLPGITTGALRAGAQKLPEGQEECSTVACITDDLSFAERQLLPGMRAAGLCVHVLQMSDPIDFSRWEYRLAVIDISTRDERGFFLCAQARSATQTPVMLVLRGQAREEVLRGFHAGADAYVTAPFDAREFLARAGALIRRATHRQPSA